jgi:hypothetical protein
VILENSIAMMQRILWNIKAMLYVRGSPLTAIMVLALVI